MKLKMAMLGVICGFLALPVMAERGDGQRHERNDQGRHYDSSVSRNSRYAENKNAHGADRQKHHRGQQLSYQSQHKPKRILKHPRYQHAYSSAHKSSRRHYYAGHRLGPHRHHKNYWVGAGLVGALIASQYQQSNDYSHHVTYVETEPAVQVSYWRDDFGDCYRIESRDGEDIYYEASYQSCGL